MKRKQKTNQVIPGSNSMCVLFCIVLFCMALPLSLFSFDATPQEKVGMPKIAFESLVVDAGVFKPGDKAIGEFIVKNEGTADLVIKRVAPT